MSKRVEILGIALYQFMIGLCIIIFLIFFPYMYQSLNHQPDARLYFENRIIKEVEHVFRSKILTFEGGGTYSNEFEEVPTLEIARFNSNDEIAAIILSYFSLKDFDFIDLDIEKSDHDEKINPAPKQIFLISEDYETPLFFDRIEISGTKEDVRFKLYEFDELTTLFPPQTDYTEVTLEDFMSNSNYHNYLNFDFNNDYMLFSIEYCDSELCYVDYIHFMYEIRSKKRSITSDRLGLLEIIARPQFIKNAYKDGFLEDMNMFLYSTNENQIYYFHVDDEKIPDSINLESLPFDKLVFYEKDGVEYFIILINAVADYSAGQCLGIWGKKSMLMDHSISIMTEKAYHYILLSVIILFIIGAVIRFFVIRRLQKQLNAILQDQGHKDIAVVPSRKKISDTFVLLSERSKIIAQHLPDQISGYLIDNRNNYPVNKARIGCLVIDLKGFTLYSENRSNFNLTRLLNAFYSICIQVVHAQNGRIDKFVGDSMVALWDINDDSEVSTKMVVSAVNISQLCAQNEIFHNSGLSIRMGIEINDGYIGIFGSELRLCYTATGDSIEFAMKLEEMNNTYQSEVLLSERVVKTCEQSIDGYIIRWVDRIKFKSNHEKIYELVPLHSPVYSLVNDNVYIKRYEMALNKYCLEEYSVAYKLFCEIQSAYPDDYLAHIFIMRCKKFLD